MESARANSTPSRRQFLGAAALASGALVWPRQKPRRVMKTLGIAYTSFPVRIRRAREAGAPLEAGQLIELCHSFGASGCQLETTQLASTEAAYLKSIRQALEEREMFLELSLGARELENPDAFRRVAGIAHALGVSRLRVALLSGRRYEDFSDKAKWDAFASHWREALVRIEPVVRAERLLVGIENHKDWLSGELAAMLRRLSSPHLGVCVDFGNNLALLEDPVAVVAELAPYVVTTHLKDMAVRPSAEGFLLSEVPLGEGFLPLGEIISTLRKRRSDVRFCLEMITRDPLRVPYREERYWTTYGARDETRVKRFEERVLRRAASPGPLPAISGMSAERAQGVEDENVRRSIAYARTRLGL